MSTPVNTPRTGDDRDVTTSADGDAIGRPSTTGTVAAADGLTIDFGEPTADELDGVMGSRPSFGLPERLSEAQGLATQRIPAELLDDSGGIALDLMETGGPAGSEPDETVDRIHSEPPTDPTATVVATDSSAADDGVGFTIDLAGEDVNETQPVGDQGDDGGEFGRTVEIDRLDDDPSDLAGEESCEPPEIAETVVGGTAFPPDPGTGSTAQTVVDLGGFDEPGGTHDLVDPASLSTAGEPASGGAFDSSKTLVAPEAGDIHDSSRTLIGEPDDSVDNTRPLLGSVKANPVGNLNQTPLVSQSQLDRKAGNKSGWDLRIRTCGVDGEIVGMDSQQIGAADPTGLELALRSHEAVSEYEVVDEVGAGAMGVVYLAKQTSLNRELAIKTLKPQTGKGAAYAQAMFVSEAVVTANLVHPNIVPIHDLGRTADGKLFYSMKRIQGTPWNKSIRENTGSAEAKLDVLMKVCDAVAFAHSRGVINRDLKPENVLLGDYGEVIVLDWGLAVTDDSFAKRESILLDYHGSAGTPCYMAPELARPDVSQIGRHSDIYLLGAMLFELLEGYPPHFLKRLWKTDNSKAQFNGVIFAALNNEIETDVRPSELMNIAMRAMATDPADRYASVEEFQEAIREYRITGRAEEILREAAAHSDGGYDSLQESLALFEDAKRRWPDNGRAVAGAREARLSYAERALRRADLDLAGQIVAGQSGAEFDALTKRIDRAQRLRSLTKSTLALLFVAAIGLAGVSFWQKTKADRATLLAVEREQEAIEAKDEAVQSEKRAVASEQVAKQEKQAAVQAREEAVEAREVAIRQERRAVALAADNERKLREIQKQAGTINELEEQEKRLDAKIASTEQQLETAGEQVERQTMLAKQKTREAEVAQTKADAARRLADEAQTKADAARKRARQAVADAEEASKRAEVATERAAAASKRAEVLVSENEAITEQNAELSQQTAKAQYDLKKRFIEASIELGEYGRAVDLIDETLALSDNPFVAERASLLKKWRASLERKTGSVDVRTGRDVSSSAIDPVSGLVAVLSRGDAPTLTVLSTDQAQQMDEAQQTDQATQRTTVPGVAEGVRMVAFSPGGSYLAATGDGRRQLWWRSPSRQTDRWRPVRLPNDVASGEGDDLTVLFHEPKDGSGLTVLFVADDVAGTVRPLRLNDEVATVAAPLQLAGRSGADFRSYDVALTPDGTHLIASTRKQSLHAFPLDWADGLPSLKAAGHASPAVQTGNRDARLSSKPNRLTVSPDGRWLALVSTTSGTGQRGGVVTLLPRSDGGFPFVRPRDERAIRLATRRPIESIVFSPDGRSLAAGLDKKYVQLWNLEDDKFVPAAIEGLYDEEFLAGHTGAIDAVAFTGSSHLITVGGDDSVRLWDLGRYDEYVQHFRDLTEVLNGDAAAVGHVSPLRRYLDGLPRHGTLPTTPPSTPSASSRMHWANDPVETFAVATFTDEPGSASSDEPIRFRESRQAFSIRFSDDDERFIVGTDDRAAHIYDARTGRRAVPDVEENGKSAQPGRTSVFFGANRSVYLEGHIPELASVQFLPPVGDLLLTQDYFGSILVWDASDDADGIGYERSRLLTEYSASEFGVSDDGSLIIAGGADPYENAKGEPKLDHYAAIWTRESVLADPNPRPAIELRGRHKQFAITAVALSPDRTRAATAGRRGEIVIWDLATATPIAGVPISHGFDQVSGISFLDDDSLLTTGYDGAINIWKRDGERLIAKPYDGQRRGVAPDYITRLRRVPGTDRFATFEVTTRRNPKTRDDETDVNVVLWEGQQPVTVFRKRLTEEEIARAFRSDLSWSSDGQSLLIVFDGAAGIYDVAAGRVTTAYRFGGLGAMRASFVPSPGDVPPTRFVSFDGQAARLWDLATGDQLADFRSHAAVYDADFSPEGGYVFTGSDSIRVFHADPESPLHGQTAMRLVGFHRGAITSIAVRPESGNEATGSDHSMQFASADRSGLIYVWDWRPADGPPAEPTLTIAPATGDATERAHRDKGGLSRVAWSSDGRSLATIQQGRLRLWHVSAGQAEPVPVSVPEGWTATWNAIAFSDDGRQLVAGGVGRAAPNAVGKVGREERTSIAVVWSLGAEAEPVAILVGRHDVDRLAESGAAGVTAVVITAGGDVLTGGTSGTINRWSAAFAEPGRVAEGESFGALDLTDGSPPHNGAVTAIDTAADGRVVSCGESGWSVVWPLSAGL